MAKAYGLDLEFVETDTSNPSAEYLKYNKLAKVPTFVGADGYVLSECIAIAIYSESGSGAPPDQPTAVMRQAHFITVIPIRIAHVDFVLPSDFAPFLATFPAAHVGRTTLTRTQSRRRTRRRRSSARPSRSKGPYRFPPIFVSGRLTRSATRRS